MSLIRQSKFGVYNRPVNQLITLAAISLMVTVLAQGDSCDMNGVNPKNSNMKTTAAQDKLATGVWGGQHVRVEVSESGAQFEFDCAHGSISQSVKLDSNGKFDVAGKFAPEHAGPVLRDEESNERAVRYAGQVNQEQMTLTISDAATKEMIGTFELKHGSESRLMKCR